MNRLFFAKISREYPQQFEKNFYAAGKEGSSWYGGIRPGDYVFPIYNLSVSKLWRVKEYTGQANEINPEGSVQFEVIRAYNPIRISSAFARYRYFNIDINIVNRLAKSMGSTETGFFEITTDPGCPPPERIDFNDTRDIYIATENPFHEPSYRDRDLRVKLSNATELKIVSIDIFKDGKFERYAPLFDLYLTKNDPQQRYSLPQLYDYAVQDSAEKKEAYIKSVIEEVKKNGFFVVGSPIRLYDNILVGRRKATDAQVFTDQQAEAEAVEEVGQAIEDYADFVNLLDANPNLILYGPPGTGKTYAARKIVEAFDHHRSKNFKKYEQIEEEGRVDFVTFHQSFSYEEFVEGLRPVVKVESGEESSVEGTNLQYAIQDGILKQIANRAALGQIKTELRGKGLERISENSAIWKISLGRAGIQEDVYQDCLKSGEIAIGFLNDVDFSEMESDEIFDQLSKAKTWRSENPTRNAKTIDYFVNKLRIGDVVLVFASVTSIRAVGVVTGDYYVNRKLPNYQHRRSVRWLKEFEEPLNILKYNNGVRLTLPTLYQLDRFKFSDIKEILVGEDGKQPETSHEIPYYLIIDEINRGNISKIFGELITLLEKDKRNVYKCKLPYSQKPFTLPSNLYIIGTMNTADRSIAVLDVALRRRFYFKEIEPESAVIDRNSDIMQYIDVIALLDKLNTKIAARIDRDHRIGHSHFLNAHAISGLRLVWYYQIIPLLMEYFYNDAGSIADIIGEAFIDRKTLQVKWIDDDAAFKQALISIK